MDGVRRAGPARTAGHRRDRPQAHRRPARVGAHRPGGPDRPAGPRGAVEPGDRHPAVHQRPHRPVPPAQGLHQARHHLAQPAQPRPALAGRAIWPACLVSGQDARRHADRPRTGLCTVHWRIRARSARPDNRRKRVTNSESRAQAGRAGPADRTPGRKGKPCCHRGAGTAQYRLARNQVNTALLGSSQPARRNLSAVGDQS